MKAKAMPSEKEMVKALREKTGAGILDCQKALQESSWDIEQAIDVLRKRGADIAAKKSGRVTHAGKIESYVHMGGKIGVLVEINCETDFVAQNAIFQQLAKDVAMQVAASNPQYVERSAVPQELIEREKEIYKEGIKGKPPEYHRKDPSGKIREILQRILLIRATLH